MKGDSSLSGARASEPASPLAHRPDLRLGAAIVRPSIRSIEGPDGTIATEPRVMQVLLALADASGAVLTRDDLMRLCWGGTIVGDDSINRAIAEVRRIARSTGAGFGVETIPRIGYRLTGGTPVNIPRSVVPELPTPDPPAFTPRLAPTETTRRVWMIGGALTLTSAVGVGIWATLRPRPDPRYLELMEKGRQELRLNLADSMRNAVAHFREATTLEPDSAAAQGLLALALYHAAELGPRSEAGAAVQDSEQAARRALALDAREPNALAALALLQRSLDDWITTERKLRQILEIAPDNAAALDALVGLLQASGYAQESWDLNERAVAFDPLRPLPQQRRALKLWIKGKPEEAHKVIARATDLWPSSPNVWNARLIIYALTGQTQAARLLIDEQGNAANPLTADGIATWKASLKALETRSPADIAVARDANLASATQSALLSVHAILVLAELGELDAAFSVIDGLLLRRGQLVTQSRTDKDLTPAQDPVWRQTMWLFTPATKALRADPRFAALADSIGLDDYWRSRGIEPDEGLPRT
jgi:DNA-binding winged helix-turn-helix (wHTH) protein/tetratricopeptide (TPR) repeat protein